jgi:cation diffusion facilitator CzcD-associated flavoprotein CzcO
MALLFLLRPNMARLTSVICRAQLFIQVRNRELRRKLTPKYSMGCKRIVFSHDYLRAFQRLNVQLVTEGIDRVTADSVVLKDGSSYPIDVLVCATGYAVADDLARFEVRGRGGRDLREEWAGEPEAYLGSSVNGFPNFFILGGPNTFLGHNSLILMMESQAIYFADAIRYAARNQVQCLEVKREVQKRYNDALQRRLNRTVWQLGGCQNWFNTKTGKNSLMWPGPSFEFRFRARRFDPKNYNIELAVPVKQV